MPLTGPRLPSVRGYAEGQQVLSPRSELADVYVFTNGVPGAESSSLAW